MTVTLYQIIVESSLRVSLVAAGVALALFMVRARTTGVRSAAWTAVLVAMLLMPVLPHVVPSIPVPVPPQTALALDRVEQPLMFGATMEGPLPPLAAFESQSASIWPVVIAGVYLLGLGWLSLRLFIGAAGARRLIRSSAAIPGNELGAPATVTVCVPVLASPLVATPITVGVLAPRIVLPATWREWPDETLQAVLSHESTHVRRRDPIVLLLARVNRAVFWFHPLAWWLERKLATTAEHACDDAAARAIGQPKRYAAVLIDMADIVRRNGGRLAWQGVGVDGAGMLRQRIERMLRGEVFRDISRTRKAVVAMGCATAIVLAVACRQKVEEVASAPLKPDPAMAQREAAQKASGDEWRAAENMTAAQVNSLEATLKQNPEDQATLKKLGIFYRLSGGKVLGWDQATPVRRAHALWMIEHHPDADTDSMFDWKLSYFYDQPGYEAAKKLWLAVVAKPGVTSKVLSNAASFFQEKDKALAEEMLLKAQAIDPAAQQLHPQRGTLYWPRRLGELYADVMLGATGPTSGSLPTYSPAEAHGVFAQAIRTKLDASKDPDLLLSTGHGMVFSHGGPDQEGEAIGRSLIQRVLTLDPTSQEARLTLDGMAERDRELRFSHLQDGTKSGQDRFTAMMALPDQDRMALLHFAIGDEYMVGEGINYAKPEALAGNLDRCRKYAENALAMAAKYPADPKSGLLIFSANTALGLLALRGGDMRTAVKDMRVATAAPVFDQSKSGRELLWSRLATYVLRYGGKDERQAVIAYVERLAQSETGAQRDYDLKSAQQIRDGVMPEWYQSMAGR